MKKSNFAITALPLLMFTSCFNFSELAVPESVSVKTDATYKVAIGQKTLDFRDKINLSELIASDSSSENFTFYDYTPAGDTSASAGMKKFLIESKIQDIEIDFSKYFENTNIAESFDAISFSQDIKVPTITINKSEALEIPDNVKTAQTTLSNDDTIDASVSASVKFTPTIDSALKECIIGEGTLTVSISEPSGWENIKISSLSVSQEDGISLSENNVDAVSKDFSLGNKKVSSKEMTISVTVSATVSKPTDLNNPPLASIKTDIKKFSSVTVDLGDSFDPSLTKESSFPEEMTNTFSQIVFDSGTGLKGNFKNGLPAVDGDEGANKITLSGVYSDFLGLGSSSSTKSKEMPAGGALTTFDLLSDAEHSQNITNLSKIDFHGKLELPGSTNEHPNYMKAQNLEAGKTYNVSLSVEPVINWKSVTIKSGALGDGATISDKIVLKDMALTSMLNEFGSNLGIDNFSSKIEFTELPFYIFCQKPEQISSLNNISMKAKIKAYLGDNSGNENSTPHTKNIIGNDSEYGVINFVSIPSLSKDSLGTVLTNMDKVSCTAKNDFSEILNATLSNSSTYLCLNYDINTSLGEVNDQGLTIKREEIKSVSNAKTSISIYAYFVLPLQLNVKNEISVNLLEVLDMDDDDLFNREEATDTSDFDDYVSAIESATLVYKASTLPFVSQKELSMQIDLDGDGSVFSNQTLYLSGGEITIQPEKLIEAMKTYPLKPNITLKLPSGNLGISSDLMFGLNIQAEIKTNGTVKIFGGE